MTIVKSLDEMVYIIKLVESKMDEPKLKDKNIEFKLMQPDELNNYLITERGAKPEVAELIEGHTMCKDGKYIVRIRAMEPEDVLETYFHELGHVATLEDAVKYKINKEQAYMIQETLAYLFQFYAEEKCNELGYGCVYPCVLPGNREKFLDAILAANPDITDYRRKAFSTIRNMLTSGESFESLYKITKKALLK